MAQKVKQDARIEIAGARAHRDTAGGSKAHGGVDRHSVAKSAQARSVAEVREDRSFRQLRAKVMHQRLVGETVKTIATNACVEVALRKWKVRCHLRHGLVKGIVEAGEMCRRGKDGLRRSDKRQRLRNVQWRKMCGGAQLFQDLRRDELMSAEVGTAMHDAMADRYRLCCECAPGSRQRQRSRASLCDSSVFSRWTIGFPSADRMCNVPCCVRCLRRFPSAAAPHPRAPR